MRLRLSRIRLNICGLENGSGRTRKQTKDRQAVIWKKKSAAGRYWNFPVSLSQSMENWRNLCLLRPLSFQRLRRN